MVDGSTAITMPANLAGATAPLLTSIELQVQHLRTVNRMDPSTTLEAVFPMWVHGVVRSDPALRPGLAEFDVSNQRINSWLTPRGLSAQFVCAWPDLVPTERGRGGCRKRRGQYGEIRRG